MSKDITARLEDARGQIEARFLDGGAVLLSVLEAVEKLIGTLDSVTSSLDAGAASQTDAALKSAIDELTGLPAREAGRLRDLGGLAVIEKELRGEVVDMRETLRYLRTFAVTAKITGAGIADFAGFAAEIIERIQYGTVEADRFSQNLERLGKQLGPAAGRAQQITESYATLIPAIVANLGDSAKQLSAHRQQLSSTAAKVRQLAGGVQMKLATILSAMQVGDITRQRIEHCQFALSSLKGFVETEAGAALSSDARLRLRTAITLLVAGQLQQTAEDFARDTQKIVANLASFRSDIREMVDLGVAMAPSESGSSDNIIQRLETDVASARDIVRRIAAGAAEADALCLSMETQVRELTAGIETMKMVRTDIQYMALNTNLRCSRIGEEGKAINVVTGELRSFAGKMDVSAENILVGLQRLNATAGGMIRTDDPSADGGVAGLDSRLEHAAAAIHTAAEAMTANLQKLGEQGRTAGELMGSALSKLDFKAQLGEILNECAERAAAEVDGDLDLTGLDTALAEVGSRIFKTYTMVAERDLHIQILGGPAEPATAAAPSLAADNDEDLFEAALF